MHTSPRLALLATAGLVGAAAITGCGNNSPSDNASAAQHTPAATTATPSAPSTGPVSVDLSEWKVTPAVSTVKAGAVTFAAHNSGSTMHELIVLRTTKPAARTSPAAPRST
jgi:uncharacterized cupredoxin-like copper-binding protein